MNAELINPFKEAILDVLSTMAKLEAKPGWPTLKQDDAAHGDVTGLIVMTVEQARGSLAVTFSERAILDISRRMLDEESNTIDATVTDLVGEITNMLNGGAKRILDDKGYHYDLAIPDVVSGKIHLIILKCLGPKIIVPFTTDSWPCYFDICFFNATEKLRLYGGSS